MKGMMGEVSDLLWFFGVGDVIGVLSDFLMLQRRK